MPWRKVSKRLRDHAEDAGEDESLYGSLRDTGYSESRYKQETLTRQAGSQGLPGLNAGGLGAGTAGPWNCDSAQGPLCFLLEADCWKGGIGQDVDPTSVCVCVYVCLHPTKDCSFSLYSKTV